MTFKTLVGVIGGVVTAGLLTSSVFAHHGWTWTEPNQVEVTGKILKIFIGPPHPQLQIETPKDGQWTVDFGNPRQTQDAGFVQGSAKEGDTVVILGNRSAKAGEKLIKAVRATINGRNYVFYPERLKPTP